jgi:hypothetical protein
MRRTLLAASVLVVTGACQAFAQVADRGRQLTGRELQALLKDGAIMRSVPCVPGESFLQEEIFAANGDYVGIQDRADVNGKASVVGDELCVEGPGYRRCRQLMRDTQGRLWLKQQFESGAPINSGQVELLPLNTPLGCRREDK